MKTLFFGLIFLLSSASYSQLLSGTLLEAGRTLLTTTTFTLKDKQTGTIVCELAVNRKGEVTAITSIKEGTTLASTPVEIKVKKMLSGFRFQAGTHYPTFQHVRVKVSVLPE